MADLAYCGPILSRSRRLFSVHPGAAYRERRLESAPNAAKTPAFLGGSVTPRRRASFMPQAWALWAMRQPALAGLRNNKLAYRALIWLAIIGNVIRIAARIVPMRRCCTDQRLARWDWLG
jgi:hypothetical protein